MLGLHATSNDDSQCDISTEASEVKTESDALDNLLGHLIIDEDRSRYISTSSWANFAWEVGSKLICC